MSDLWQYEREYPDLCVAGTDEAGRGPLAGPVVAAAVVLNEELPGVKDSKKLSSARRGELDGVIRSQARAVGVALASVEEIEQLNILNASQLAMRRAVAELSVTPDIVLVDGNVARDFALKTRCIVKGDAHSASIAAASIVAKVRRDALMLALHETYPQYGFDRHKGYPTALHYERLREYGPCPAHRPSFLKKSRTVGELGEREACELLTFKGYRILRTQYRTRGGEVDVIAQKDDVWVFVEVKTRKNKRFARAADAVDPHKQEKYRRCARHWLAEHGDGYPIRFDVIEVYTEEKGIVHLENAFV